MTVTILIGDALARLATLPDNSVDMICTSPPYYAVRDYQTARWDGGNEACEHQPSTHRNDGPGRRGVCLACGAVRLDDQIGLDATPDAFIDRLADVFAECLRILRPEGIALVNIDDTYAGSWGSQSNQANKTRIGRYHANAMGAAQTRAGSSIYTPGIQPKERIGIPWMFAFACRRKGWRIRQEIIWHKPNAMPEPVKDRCTRAHEPLFLMTKSEQYHWDADAIAERAVTAGAPIKTPDGWDTQQRSHGAIHQEGREKGEYRGDTQGDTRNARSVWSIPTEAYTEAHFATFPTELAKRCILAGSREGGVVLDPFGGSGTTGLVADRLQRHAILVELSPDYARQARERIIGDAPGGLLIPDVRFG